jgi:hypothetical protein
MIMVKVIKRKKFIINNMENKKIRQYRSNQGRSPQRESESMKVIVAAAVIGLIGSLLYLIISSIW